VVQVEESGFILILQCVVSPNFQLGRLNVVYVTRKISKKLSGALTEGGFIYVRG